MGDAAGVHRLHACQRTQQRRLAAAVTAGDNDAAAVPADDTDAFAILDTERDSVEDDPRAVGLADAFDVDQVHAGAPSPVTTRAPATGPSTRRTVRHTPSPASADAIRTDSGDVRASSATVGPDPDTTAPTAPSSRPASSTRASCGRSARAAVCK